VAGPDRPIPEPPKVQPAAAARGPSAAAKLSAEAQSAQSNLYARLSSALNDRGPVSVLSRFGLGFNILYRQALGDLEDRFNSLESGSKSMVDQVNTILYVIRTWN
jgi:syntaxin-binding protein 5